uniref:Uncharacterized protein n=1 Tax=Arundo donax TaxID=35708 RepID=A0A0A9G7V4_ARUDO
MLKLPLKSEEDAAVARETVAMPASSANVVLSKDSSEDWSGSEDWSDLEDVSKETNLAVGRLQVMLLRQAGWVDTDAGSEGQVEGM